MNLDDCKSDWKQRHRELAQESLGRLNEDVVVRTARLEASIRQRDRMEMVAAVVVLLGFGLFLGLETLPMPWSMKTGIVIMMLAVVEIAAVTYWTRHRRPRLHFELPLLEFYAAEILRLDRRIQLARNITWWYSGPLLLGACVMIFGVISAVPELPARVFVGFLAAFYICFLAAAVIIYRGSRRAVVKELIPMRDEMIELMKTSTDAPD